MKNCPFCNGPPEPKHRAGSYGYYPAKDWIECKDCGACGPVFEDQKNGKTINSKKLAEDAWERRGSLKVMYGNSNSETKGS